LQKVKVFAAVYRFLRNAVLAYSFDGLVVVSLLVICSCAYFKRVPRVHSWLLNERKGFLGVFYKVGLNSNLSRMMLDTFFWCGGNVLAIIDHF
uniref:Protein kish n=1 Tax=Enterobius vermicularis TaxID=51028 RepID=A0A0N4UVC0_ENTVE